MSEEKLMTRAEWEREERQRQAREDCGATHAPDPISASWGDGPSTSFCRCGLYQWTPRGTA